MRKVCCVLLGIFLCISGADVFAAVRSQNTVSTQTRQTSKTKTESQNRSASARATSTNVVKRQTSARNAKSNKVISGRVKTNKKNSSRSATTTSAKVLSRATAATATKTFGTNYNTCRDEYFTCMDQFCATQNESYRRCICSSKLKSIQDQERLLSQTSDSLKDFESLNIDMISKTTNEVKAMMSASDGESAIKQDTSASSNTLKNISGVLSKTKQESLSTQGKLDIGGNIKEIWTTTNLIGGSDIANLTGENLFNAVHAQCAEIVAEACAESDLKMVASSYGMYIENDCAVLENNLKNQKASANVEIRNTRHKMQDARLENYDAHNSESINDCIAKVRQDILMDTACGQDYIHCLDFSGKYLSVDTGIPRYTPEFYQLENQISLSGDVLQNEKNAYFVSMLDAKREFAEKDLDLCRDDADEVWNEFLRQALVEIYQGQQARVREVKNECLKVVNECYNSKSDQLKDLTDDSAKINLGLTLELSEEMCADKLETCSNLYGGGTEGLTKLVATMRAITDETITQSCSDLLLTFAKNICAVPDNDTKHTYPFNCRRYAPGESKYALNEVCNTTLVNPFSRSEILNADSLLKSLSNYTNMCVNNNYIKKYLSCRKGFYLYNPAYCSENSQYSDPSFNGSYISSNDRNQFCYALKATSCAGCPSNAICAGGTDAPVTLNQDLYGECGEYYIGSLYQEFVIFALQNCRRPSDTTNDLSESLLIEIDKAFQQVRTEIKSVLRNECEAYNGTWDDMPWIDNNLDGAHDYNTDDRLRSDFYENTGASVLWGYCK